MGHIYWKTTLHIIVENRVILKHSYPVLKLNTILNLDFSYFNVEFRSTLSYIQTENYFTSLKATVPRKTIFIGKIDSFTTNKESHYISTS